MHNRPFSVEMAKEIDQVGRESPCCVKRHDRKSLHPDNLPVSQEKQDILDAIRDHHGGDRRRETGSGKTTQLPKICMELGAQD